MKEVCCKVLAAVFILLIIASMVQMRRDIVDCTHGSYITVPANTIQMFDTVLVGDKRYIGIVEQVTNNLYHVIYTDRLHHAVHGIYTKEQLQKVLIVVPKLQ